MMANKNIFAAILEAQLTRCNIVELTLPPIPVPFGLFILANDGPVEACRQ